MQRTHAALSCILQQIFHLLNKAKPRIKYDMRNVVLRRISKNGLQGQPY